MTTCTECNKAATASDRLCDECAGGPAYPNLGPTVAKFRRQQANPDPFAYGQAVRAAIRDLQRAELQRSALRGYGHQPCRQCASGTPHNTAKKILAAVREQQKRSLQSATSRLSDEALREAYLEAMAAKHLPRGEPVEPVHILNGRRRRAA